VCITAEDFFNRRYAHVLLHVPSEVDNESGERKQDATDARSRQDQAKV